MAAESILSNPLMFDPNHNISCINLAYTYLDEVAYCLEKFKHITTPKTIRPHLFKILFQDLQVIPELRQTLGRARPGEFRALIDTLKQRLEEMHEDDYKTLHEYTWPWYRRYNKTRESITNKKRKMNFLQNEYRKRRKTTKIDGGEGKTDSKAQSGLDTDSKMEDSVKTTGVAAEHPYNEKQKEVFLLHDIDSSCLLQIDKDVEEEKRNKPPPAVGRKKKKKYRLRGRSSETAKAHRG
eukprot:TRINITY_DN1129_c0_g1_i1.p1 TRINITY_DN1129_c0_g1~~TRINITY_DN1129_c0_g1_i1.p1  ORF type:complete len:238 (-),score=61.32 TRINITY_DN1129_c0_g1_i1:2-715(-)